ncbi:MAG: porin [Pseudomonadota bacterium]
MRARVLVAAIVLLGSLAARAGETIPNIQTGYENGFFLKTDDDRFRFKFGSRVVFGFSEGILSTALNYGKFDALYAKFFAGGNAFGADLQYYFEAAAASNPRPIGPVPNPASNAGTFVLDDYFVRYLHGDMILKLGRFKVPFGRGWTVLDSSLEFVNRSGAVQAFTFGRDLGVAFTWERPAFAATAGIFNGGRDTKLGVGYDVFAFTPATPPAATVGGNGFLYVARVVAMPFGPAGNTEGDVEDSEGSRLDLGAGAVLDHRRDADFNWDGVLDDTKVSVLTAATDITWKREGKSVQGEFFYRKIYAAATPETTGMGFYLQPGYFLVPRKLELAGRLGWLDPDLDKPGDRIWEAAGALNLHFSGDHRYKTQLQYAWKRFDDRVAGPKDDHFIDLVFQLTI